MTNKTLHFSLRSIYLNLFQEKYKSKLLNIVPETIKMLFTQFRCIYQTIFFCIFSSKPLKKIFLEHLRKNLSLMHSCLLAQPTTQLLSNLYILIFSLLLSWKNAGKHFWHYLSISYQEETISLLRFRLCSDFDFFFFFLTDAQTQINFKLYTKDINMMSYGLTERSVDPKDVLWINTCYGLTGRLSEQESVYFLTQSSIPMALQATVLIFLKVNIQ